MLRSEIEQIEHRIANCFDRITFFVSVTKGIETPTRDRILAQIKEEKAVALEAFRQVRPCAGCGKD